jgi:hypothetical protein
MPDIGHHSCSSNLHSSPLLHPAIAGLAAAPSVFLWQVIPFAASPLFFVCLPSPALLSGTTAIISAPVSPVSAPVSRALASLRSLRKARAPEAAAVTGSPSLPLFFGLGSRLPDFLGPCSQIAPAFFSVFT